MTDSGHAEDVSAVSVISAEGGEQCCGPTKTGVAQGLQAGDRTAKDDSTASQCPTSDDTLSRSVADGSNDVGKKATVSAETEDVSTNNDAQCEEFNSCEGSASPPRTLPNDVSDSTEDRRSPETSRSWLDPLCSVFTRFAKQDEIDEESCAESEDRDSSRPSRFSHLVDTASTMYTNLGQSCRQQWNDFIHTTTGAKVARNVIPQCATAIAAGISYSLSQQFFPDNDSLADLATWAAVTMGNVGEPVLADYLMGVAYPRFDQTYTTQMATLRLLTANLHSIFGGRSFGEALCDTMALSAYTSVVFGGFEALWDAEMESEDGTGGGASAPKNAHPRFVEIPTEDGGAD